MEKKFYIQTFGCAMNVNDSLMIETKFYEKGWQKVETVDDASFAIFNTCAVREKAENKALSNIQGLKSKFTKKSGRRLAIIGCSAQNKKEQIKEIVPFVSYIIGSDEYRKFDDILDNYSKIRDGLFVEESIEELYEDFVEDYKVDGLTAEISITRGCNNFCTYCIVPYTRGRERSRSADLIIKDVQKLHSQGVVDVTLLGQNVNSYKDGDINFPKLLKRVVEETKIPRIRFLTSHPKDFSAELIDVMASDERICNFLHLPFQAGANSVLKSMNRGYTREDYISKIKLLRGKIPNIALSTDIITGFCGESEEDFQETLNLVKEIRFDSAFTFHYSKRAGTKADECLNDDVPENIKLDRLKRLIDVQNEICKEKSKEQIGKNVNILFDSKELTENKGYIYKGKTIEGKVATVESDEELIGKIRDAKVYDATTWALKCKLI